MQYRAVGEFLIVEKLPWLKTDIALPDSMKSDQGVVRGKVLSIGNQQDHFDNLWSSGNDGKLKINDIILYDSRVGLEINQDEKTGAFLIRFANILAIELEEPASMKKEAKKKKPRKKKKAGKKRAATLRGKE